MNRSLLLSLSLSSCSLLIPLLQGERCDPIVFRDRCEQGELLVCRDDVVFHVDCGQERCNEDRVACGVCGDGVLNTENNEECDDANNNDEDACLSSCLSASCGDGIARTDLAAQAPGFEACDDGNTIEGDGCDSNCTISACGNAISVVGEVCFEAPAVVDVGSSLRGAALGDLDGDQQLDLVVARFAPNNQANKGELRVFHNNAGALSLSGQTPLAHPPSAIAIADFDEERGPDIAVALEEISALQIFFNNGLGGSVTSTTISNVGSGVTSLFVSDQENNATPDVVVARASCDNILQCRVLLLLNPNAAGAQPSELALGFQRAQSNVISADLNGDLSPDIISALPVTRELAINLMNTPQENIPVFFSLSDSPLSLVADDFDQDGDQDLVVRFVNTVKLFSNDSSADLSDTQEIFASTAQGAAKIDLDGDQEQDLALTTQSPPTLRLFQNSAGVFQEIAPIALEGDPSALLVGDLNNDGRDDLIVLDLISSQITVILSQP